MSLVHKLITAVRGGARESMQVVVDANLLRILAEEIYTAEQAINKAKYDLTQVVVQKRCLQSEVKNCQKTIHNMEQKTAEALQENRQGLAQECAEWIAENEFVLRDMQSKQEQIEQYELRLTANLKKAAHTLNQYRRELHLAKATANSQSASVRLNQRSNGIAANFTAMEESLDRIKLVQQNCDDQIAAKEEVDAALMDVSSRVLHQSTRRVAVEDVLQRVRRNNPSANPES